jgi:hypothetical protein
VVDVAAVVLATVVLYSVRTTTCRSTTGTYIYHSSIVVYYCSTGNPSTSHGNERQRHQRLGTNPVDFVVQMFMMVAATCLPPRPLLCTGGGGEPGPGSMQRVGGGKRGHMGPPVGAVGRLCARSAVAELARGVVDRAGRARGGPRHTAHDVSQPT